MNLTPPPAPELVTELTDGMTVSLPVSYGGYAISQKFMLTGQAPDGQWRCELMPEPGTGLTGMLSDPGRVGEQRLYDTAILLDRINAQNESAHHCNLWDWRLDQLGLALAEGQTVHVPHFLANGGGWIRCQVVREPGLFGLRITALVGKDWRDLPKGCRGDAYEQCNLFVLDGEVEGPAGETWMPLNPANVREAPFADGSFDGYPDPATMPVVRTYKRQASV